MATLDLEYLAGVVILYNPDEDLLLNIQSYQENVSKLYIVDNSDKINHRLLNTLFTLLTHYDYIPLRENKGIAYALNIAAEKAIKEGFNWLLTMDQDSQASSRMVPLLIAAGKTIQLDQLGLLAPQYNPELVKEANQDAGLKEVDVVITSGSILNLKAYLEVGPFKNDFFIDYVDHEYCLRLKSHGFKVIIANNVPLNHKLGNSKKHKILGVHLEPSNHNFIRRYYITRNRLAVISEYKIHFSEYCRNERTKNLKDLIKIILLEDDKLKKMKSIIQGHIDFKNNKFGKFNY